MIKIGAAYIKNSKASGALKNQAITASTVTIPAIKVTIAVNSLKKFLIFSINYSF